MASLNIKSQEKIRDDFLGTYRAELIRRGINNPNVSFGTEIYVKATALAQQVAVAMQNTQQEGDALMPDTALGADMIRFAGFFGMKLRAAAGSVGQVIFHTNILASIPVLVSADTQLQDDAGLIYKVSATGFFKEGDKIEIQAVDTGISTNLKINSTLKWVLQPPFATAIVETAFAFTGGTDNENIEGLRGRVLERLANPPGGGNWSQVVGITEDSTAAIQKAFVYPAINGPATAGVAIASAPTDVYKGRDFNGDVSILNNFAIPAVLGNFPEFAEFIITNCVNQPIDISLGLSLPQSKKASIPGNGTGWVDANIFPIPIISGTSYVTGFCDVTSVATSTLFNLNVDATIADALVASSSIVNICWISKNDWILRTAQATVSGAFSPYTVALTVNSDPFVDTLSQTIQIGDYVFPASLNVLAYYNAILAEFAGFGPGQKLDPLLFSALFPRAFRRPTIQDAWPSDIGPSVLKFLSETGKEILDVQYLYKQDVGAGPGKCPIPTDVQVGPFILTPNNIGFYPII